MSTSSLEISMAESLRPVFTTFDRSAMPNNLLTVAEWCTFARATKRSGWHSAARYYAEGVQRCADHARQRRFGGSHQVVGWPHPAAYLQAGNVGLGESLTSRRQPLRVATAKPVPIETGERR